MKITEKTAFLMMDSIAFTLVQTFRNLYGSLDLEEFTEKINDTTRELFVAFCEGEGIEEIECEEG